MTRPTSCPLGYTEFDIRAEFDGDVERPSRFWRWVRNDRPNDLTYCSGWLEDGLTESPCHDHPHGGVARPWLLDEFYAEEAEFMAKEPDWRKALRERVLNAAGAVNAAGAANANRIRIVQFNAPEPQVVPAGEPVVIPVGEPGVFEAAGDIEAVREVLPFQQVGYMANLQWPAHAGQIAGAGVAAPNPAPVLQEAQDARDELNRILEDYRLWNLNVDNDEEDEDF